MLLIERTEYKVRLLRIDAPEKHQPYGNRAKQELSAKVFGKEVHVVSKGQNKYGRTLGVVEIEGRDVNLEMVKEGLAWSYRSKPYAEAEQEARKAKVGLWTDPNPIPPWEWRKRSKRQLSPAA